MENKRTAIDFDKTRTVLESEILKWKEGNNIRFILEQISFYFNEAVGSIGDKEKLGEAIKRLKIYESNLGEKYRDTQEERDYIVTVNQAINYFSSM